MAGKYEPLQRHLAALVSAERAVVELSFSEIAELVSGLPASAYESRQWWANSDHTQAQAWRAANWHVKHVNFDRQRVRFARGVVGARPSEDPGSADRVTSTTNVASGPVSGNLVQAGSVGTINVYAERPVASRSQQHLRLCLARVEFRGVVSAGTVISRRLVITTASVFPGPGPDVALGAAATVSFPLFDADVRIGATIVTHRPQGLDLVVLRLDGPPPQRLARVPFRGVDDHWGNTARIVGVGETGVVNAKVMLLGRRLDGWVQAELTAPMGSGFLGAPVWDDAVAAVVGVVIAPDHVLLASKFADVLGLRLDTADPDPPPLAILRRAYRLGFRDAMAARIEALPASDDRDKLLADQRADLADDRDFLGLAEHRSAPGAHPRLAVQLARAADSRKYREDLAKVHGEQAERAYAAGFLLGNASAMLPPAECRARNSTALAERFADVGLPADLGEAAAALIAHPTAYAADFGEVSALDDRVNRWFDDRLADEEWTVAGYQAVWGFARNAALAAALHERGADEQVVESEFLASARGFGDSLDLVAPALPPRTDDDALNGAHALHFVLELGGKPNSELLARRYGRASAHLLVLCTRLHGWLVYPEEEFRRWLAAQVPNICAEVRVPAEVSTPLIAVLRSEQDYHAVKEAVLAFGAALTKHWTRTDLRH